MSFGIRRSRGHGCIKSEREQAVLDLWFYGMHCPIQLIMLAAITYANFKFWPEVHGAFQICSAVFFSAISFGYCGIALLYFCGLTSALLRLRQHRGVVDGMRFK